MLLLSTMLILPVLSASDFPYFSSFPKLGEKEGSRPMLNEEINKITKDMIFIFDPASERTLEEYIWIDQM